MKRISLVIAIVCFAFSIAIAQRTISGVVQDEAGESLIGASLLVKGTTSGTVTDIDGRFSLAVPANAELLVVSYTGFSTLEYPIGTASEVTITLSESASQLNEVVVTALGIRKEKKALGYSVATIGSGQVENRVESDVGRILRGKAAGVDITQTSGVAGSGTNIIIRGYSSISGSNQPLFVVDGVPFNSSTNTDQGFQTGGATASSRFLDLDPNNIAEISVLKGLSATVLYGEQGANGVILVTTKNGQGGAEAKKGFEISVTQGVARTEVANLPEYQNSYGNGFSGNFGWFFSNWGPSFDTRGSNGIDENGQIEHPLDQERYNAAFPEFEGARYDYRPYDNVSEFFQAGSVYNTSVNVDKNFGNGISFNANYSYLDDTGFVPQNTFQKHNAGVGGKVDLANGLKISTSLNVVSSERVSPPASIGFGSNPAGASVFANVLYTPRSVDLAGLPFQNPIDGSQVYYRRGSAIQNPRWGLANMFDREEVNRYFGNVALSYDITDWLTASYRIGVDTYNQISRREINKGGSQVPDGQLLTSNRNNTIIDQVLNLSFDTELSESFNLSGIVGLNNRTDRFNRNTVSSTQQFIFGLFNQSNFIEHVGSQFVQNEGQIGLYGSLTAGFNRYLYLTASARNDWSSTLEAANRSILYPSVSVAFVPTDAFESLQGSRVLNYLKLRAGYGTSARFPNPYTTRPILGSATNVSQTPAGAALNTNSVSNRLGNTDLKPELLGELEFGVEGRFFNNRVGLDFSIYDKQSSDLLVDLDLDPASGFTVTTINAAEVSNKGIEVSLNLIPVKTKDFTWDMTWNLTSNENEVISVADGVDQVTIAGYTNLGNFAIPGQPFGAIQGSAFVRGPNGGLLVGANGEYQATNDIEIIGDPNPNYSANWLNTISYKGVSLNWQFSYTDGGDIYSVTTATMLARGLTSDSDFDRFLPLILPGEDAEGNANTVQGYVGDYGFAAFFGADEGTIFDGTVIRLREISLGYSLPASLLDKTPFGSVSIRLAGENLYYYAPNFPEGVNFDPEVLSLGVGNGRGFDYLTGPTAKKYGATLSLTF
ncbi:SusC/RagA family TonB-linked outer membrane protein [Neolewinella agarilytica]|uniref:TonB-linked outer membrane protein, SusC/RagA family n=1 Tax=Neolewinella agarilytica TaxID=478744 RepID=A0A1H9J3Q0_9BACT|nr:SusC/RagA family TonB-linked outer membrane protein [Neolewinella agarilytica]SEQ81418.1 TonB-linked outer membrane protein, SusC/RagA family [Neolewinella agarilytica]